VFVTAKKTDYCAMGKVKYRLRRAAGRCSIHAEVLPQFPVTINAAFINPAINRKVNENLDSPCSRGVIISIKIPAD
jgi:hypothetical protein